MILIIYCECESNFIIPESFSVIPLQFCLNMLRFWIPEKENQFTDFIITFPLGIRTLLRAMYLEHVSLWPLPKWFEHIFKDLNFHAMKAKWDCCNSSKKLNLLTSAVPVTVTNMMIIIPKLIKKKKNSSLSYFVSLKWLAHYVLSTAKCINIFYGIPLDLVDCLL